MFTDLEKLINNLNVSYIVLLKDIPISKNLSLIIKKGNFSKKNLISNGDDYQILFTASKRYRSIITSVAKKMNQKITLIGKINKGYKKNSIKFNNRPQNLSKLRGYSHKF